MKLFFLALLASCFCSLAVAQTCDLSMTMKMTDPAGKTQTTASSYTGLDKAEVQDIVTRSQPVLDEASKGKKGGGYSFVFAGSNTCGVQMIATEPIEASKPEALKVYRKAFAVALDTIKQAEDGKHFGKGKK